MDQKLPDFVPPAVPSFPSARGGHTKNWAREHLAEVMLADQGSIKALSGFQNLRQIIRSTPDNEKTLSWLRGSDKQGPFSKLTTSCSLFCN